MIEEYLEELNGIVPTPTAREIYEDCKHNIPEIISKEGPDAEMYFVKYEWLKKCWESSEYRMFEFVDKDGNVRAQDIASPNCKGIIAKYGGSKKEQAQAQELRNKYFTKFAQVLSVAKRQLNKILKPDYPIALIESANEVLDLYGKYYTHEDVKAYVSEKRGYNIPLIKLKIFFNDHIDVIQSKRNSYVMQNKEFRVATETGRLETLNNMLMQYELAMQRNPNNTRVGELTLKVLEQARKECKGERLFLTVDGKIDVNAMLHGNDNVLTSMQRLPVNLMVVGIVAAKSGINPMNLIAQLSGSYYKDYNGFGKVIKEGNDVDRPSELIRLMDWEDVGRRVNNCVFNELGDLSTAIVMDEENVPVVEDKRSKLLEMLKNDMNSSRTNIAKERETWSELKDMKNTKREIRSDGNPVPRKKKDGRGRPKKDKDDKFRE